LAQILIIGGAGFVGAHVAEQALAAGHGVRIFDARPPVASLQRLVGSAEMITGDVRDRAALAVAAEGRSVIVNLAAVVGPVRAREAPEDAFEGTRNVLDEARAAGLERVIHISSTAVYGVPDEQPLLETDRLHGVGPYGEAKVKAEEVCFEYRKKGLCVPVLRPKSFVGPERLGVFALLYDWAKDGKNFPMIGSGNNRYQLLDVEDLCDAIYLAATVDREKANDTFNIGAKVFTTMKQDYQAVLDRAGFGKKIVGFPAAPMIMALKVLEFFHLSPLYKWVYETAGTDSFVSIEKAERVLGYAPKYSTADAMVRNYDWYIAHLHEFEHASGVSHRVPWKQGILGLAKRFF